MIFHRRKKPEERKDLAGQELEKSRERLKESRKLQDELRRLAEDNHFADIIHKTITGER